MTTEQKWQVALGIISLGLFAWYVLSIQEGGGDGLSWRLHWYLEQDRRHREREREFQRSNARMQYQAWEIVTDSQPG